MAKLLKNFRTRINEAEARTIVVTFGRFNPPTTGHEKLIKAMEKVAAKEKGDFRIYPSHSQDPKKNPLSHADKVKFMRKIFRKYSRNIVDDSSVKTLFNLATQVYKDGYRKIVFVVGADRIKEIEALIPKYNGVEGRHGFYDFEEIKVVSAGNRVDPDSEKAKEMTADSMSASVLRKLAADGDFDTFKQGVPDTLGETDKRVLFNKIRTGMKLAAINEAFENLFNESVVIVEKAPPDEKIQKWLEDDKVKASFKDQYGDDWEEVMYATAWKMYNDKKGINEAWNVDDELDEEPEIKTGKSLNAVRSTFKTGEKEKPVNEVVLPGIMYEFADLENLLAEANGLLNFFEADNENVLVRIGLTKIVEQTTALVELVSESQELPDWAQNKVASATDFINAVHGYMTYSNEAPISEQFISEAVTQRDLDGIEKYADRIFAKVGIDVNFTRHFLDRVNDARNKKEITVGELTRLFKQSYQKFGKKIAQLGPDAEAVINDMMTDINMPFVLKWDNKNQELDLVAKTVMRKKNFATSNQKFRVEAKEEKPEDDPCWAGHKQVGMKDKNGKKVPNCVPVDEEELEDDDPEERKKNFAVNEELLEVVKKVTDDNGDERWALVSRKDPGKVLQYYDGKGKPPKEWIDKVERRVHAFSNEGVNEMFEALEWGTEESVKAHKQNTPGEVEEETTAQWIEKIMSKSIKKGKYEKAADALRRWKEKVKSGKKTSTGMDPTAAEFLRLTGLKLDARLLAKMVEGCEVHNAIGHALDNNKSMHEMFRPYSDNFYAIFREARKLGVGEGLDKELIESTDIGKLHIIGDDVVPLDVPMIAEEEDVELNAPKRGGSKKFYVYTRNDKGNVVKVEFGDTSGLKAKINDPEARKSFVARHDCDNKTDKTTPGYWSCRLPKYAKELGLEGGGDYYW